MSKSKYEKVLSTWLSCHTNLNWATAAGRGRQGEVVEVFIFYALTVKHTHREFASLCRIMSVQHPLKKCMQRKAELTSCSRRRNWQLASGNWRLATWPGLHPIGQKVNFLCSSSVVLLLISYVCYCCFCSSRVASWANGLLLAKLTHTHTVTGGTLGQHVLGAVCAPKCKSPGRALMLTRPLAV